MALVSSFIRNAERRFRTAISPHLTPSNNRKDELKRRILLLSIQIYHANHLEDQIVTLSKELTTKYEKARKELRNYANTKPRDPVTWQGHKWKVAVLRHELRATSRGLMSVQNILFRNSQLRKDLMIKLREITAEEAAEIIDNTL
jgi:hypothetical protein